MERQTRTDEMEVQRTFTTPLRKDADSALSRAEAKTPFENFESLAAKLLKVPKEEVDEARKRK
jgi:hypothetical protein